MGADVDHHSRAEIATVGTAKSDINGLVKRLSVCLGA